MRLPWQIPSVSTERLAHRRRDDNGTGFVARPSKGAGGRFPPACARWRPYGAGTVPSEAGMSPTNLSKSPGGSVLSICRGRLSCITLKPSRPEQLNRSVSFDLGRSHGNYPDSFCLFMRFLQGQLSAGFSGMGCYLVDSSRSRASGSSNGLHSSQCSVASSRLRCVCSCPGLPRTPSGPSRSPPRR